MPGTRGRGDARRTGADAEMPFGRWLRERYLRWWFWIGALFVYLIALGVLRGVLDYDHFLLSIVPAAAAAAFLAFRLYRRIWPPGPDDIPEFRTR